MNIYMHCEIFLREFDSKLLLAILAASKGHQVIVSDIESIEKGIKRGFLKPGIFHTKSLTPSKKKILRHKYLVKTGCKISSIDEEGGLVVKGYDEFAKRRYSDDTLETSSMVFAWGKEDSETLKKIFPKYSSKIYMTGSPRVDLWKPMFSDTSSIPSKFSKKPYILITSNLGSVNGNFSFHETIKKLKRSDYHKRDPNIINVCFGRAAEQIKIIYSFIEAIELLAKNNKGYDIVLRPHPSENIESWKIFLKDIANVYVIREGPINAWVKGSFAVIHNGCTTGYEAIVCKKTLISYVPFPLKYGNDLTNQLGYIVNDKHALLNMVNNILSHSKTNYEKKFNLLKNNLLLDKIYLDNNELSAEKILKVWEQNEDCNLSNTNNWFLFKLSLKIMKLNGIFGGLFKRLINKNFQKRENFKFPPLNEKIINEKKRKLQKVLGISEQIDCQLLSDRTLLIKKR